jgi:DNA-binding NarL/FixJ family response regulator
MTSTTTCTDDAYVHQALKAGARGFLLKDADTELLVRAIHAAADGDALIAPTITARLLEKFADVSTDPSPPEPVEPRSDREEETLLEVARGLTNAEIADKLHVSTGTAKAVIGHLMTKIGTRNRVELAIWAHETGRMQRTQ